eukprot:m.530081 g.530081  ORF g.530081 m.530081 type:complete len:543 (-) comp57567_c1_seq7:54-1682(-)
MPLCRTPPIISHRLFCTNLPAAMFSARILPDAPHRCFLSSIRYAGNWYIFTRHKKDIRLYVTSNLINNPWREHSKSPVATNEEVLAGRPVVFDSDIHRFVRSEAVDSSTSIRVLRVIVLDQNTFRETQVAEYAPRNNGLWNSKQLARVDVLELPNGHWLGSFDGALVTAAEIFYNRQSSFLALKFGLLIVLTGVLLLALIRNHGQHSFDWLRAKVSQGAQLFSLATHQLPSCSPIRLLLIVGNIAACWTLVGIVVNEYAFTAVCFAGYEKSSWSTAHQPAPLSANVNPKLAHDDVVLVTAASEVYAQRLENLIGSIHYWEPNTRILVWNLGLSEESYKRISCYRHVTIRSLDLAALPAHVSIITNYAFKPTIFFESLQEHPAILYFDSGIELRAPLTEIRNSLLKHGYWMARQYGEVLQETHPHMFEKLGIERSCFSKKQFCAGGLHGYVRDSDAYRKVLLPTLRCAFDVDCIAPPPWKNLTQYSPAVIAHQYDQSAFSIYMHKAGFLCTPDEQLYPNHGGMHQVSRDETKWNDEVMVSPRK